MKWLKIISIFTLIFLLCACQAHNAEETPKTTENIKSSQITVEQEDEPMNQNNFYITAGDTTFTAAFADNSSAEAFAELLRKGDLTIKMNDYRNFEKVGEIGASLPRNDQYITTEPGDVILYLGTSITIYYDTNSWNFTRLGKIQNAAKDTLLAVLGQGDIEVTFSLTKPSRATP